MDIKKGEEVTASYIGDSGENTATRQERLRNGWDFECDCPKCSANK